MSSKQVGIFVFLLIVFFPAAFVYLIYLAGVKSKGNVPAFHSGEPVNRSSSEWTVLVNKGSKVYHCDQICANNINAEEMPESKAIKLGLHRCKRCFGNIEVLNTNEIDRIECNLVGSIYPNPDGTSRQTYLVKSKPGEDLIFKPMPTKEYPDTIGVLTKKGCIGVLPYTTVNKLRGLYAENKASATIKEIFKSERGLGCSIEIIIYK